MKAVFPLSLVACIAALTFGTTARAQLVLDDFSTSHPGSYNYVPIVGSAPDSFAISSGTFQPTLASGDMSAWIWNQGQKLAAVGDTVSVDVSIPQPAAFTEGATMGLYLTPSISGAVEGTSAAVRATDGPGYVLEVFGPGTVISYGLFPTTTSFNLSVEMTAKSAGSSTYSVALTGEGNPAPASPFSFTAPVDSLYFGLFAAGPTTTAASLDNLTLAAVPEPGAYALVFGVLAVGFGLFTRRARTA